MRFAVHGPSHRPASPRGHRPLDNGTSGNSTVSVAWSQVGFSGSADVTDLGSGKHVGTVAGSYSATLRPGETRLIRARPL